MAHNFLHNGPAQSGMSQPSDPKALVDRFLDRLERVLPGLPHLGAGAGESAHQHVGHGDQQGRVVCRQIHDTHAAQAIRALSSVSIAARNSSVVRYG